MANNDNGIDFAKMAAHLDEFREVARTLLAALQDEGFTNREAHRITTHILAPPVEDAAKKVDDDMRCDFDCDTCHRE